VRACVCLTVRLLKSEKSYLMTTRRCARCTPWASKSGSRAPFFSWDACPQVRLSEARAALATAAAQRVRLEQRRAKLAARLAEAHAVEAAFEAEVAAAAAASSVDALVPRSVQRSVQRAANFLWPASVAAPEGWEEATDDEDDAAVGAGGGPGEPPLDDEAALPAPAQLARFLVGCRTAPGPRYEAARARTTPFLARLGAAYAARRVFAPDGTGPSVGGDEGLNAGGDSAKACNEEE
jgi:hypothetical protein